MGDNSIALLIPAYNAAGHLPRLLASARAQTVPFDEIWVYDDCSKDDTAAVAQSLGAQVVAGDVNRGCSHGKNVLASHTRCGWVHFHDADDELLPGFVETARNYADEERADVVLFGFEERRDDGQTLVHEFDAERLAVDPLLYAIEVQINAICGLYRRSAILGVGGYDTDPKVLYNEDVAFHIRLALAGLKFTADRQVLIVNHRLMRSMSASNQEKCIAANFEVMRKTATAPQAAHCREAIARRLWAIAGAAAAYLDWNVADQAAELATELAGNSANRSSRMFRLLCRVSPRLALRVREYAIRAIRPGLRVARG
jgi:glycosyltransferase involved in cell wall biosynthesis